MTRGPRKTLQNQLKQNNLKTITLTKEPPKMKKVLGIVLLNLLFSCNSKPKFSETEKAQAKLFIEVIELDNKSINISNSHTSYKSITADEIKSILNLKTEALVKAEQIPITVLAKMNKDLPKSFENYKKGLSLRIENLKTGNINAEIDGSELLEEWTIWYEVNKKYIRIPKL